MSVDVKNFISWIRTFLDDVYAPKGQSGLTIDDVYPVGSIYMSANNVNPSTLFGGTWVQIKDRFLLAKGDSYTTNGATGGEATHTLTTDEMPSHNHGSKSLSGTMRVLTWKGTVNPSGICSYSGSNTGDIKSTSGSNFGSQTYNVNATHTHDSNGGGQAHNNMPPYLVVNVWKRTA